MDNEELVQKASAVLKSYTTKEGRLFGDVGAALISKKGNIYTGVCVDTASWGLCAERSAMATMITHGEYQIEKIVAVWKDEKTGALYVLPPCGVCREFMRQVDAENLHADVVLGKKDTLKLRDLLPRNEWPEPF